MYRHNLPESRMVKKEAKCRYCVTQEALRLVCSVYIVHMPSKRKVVEQIDKAECTYRECWQFLAELKNLPEVQLEVTEFFEFQPKLASCLFELDDIYRVLHREKTVLIGKKQSVSKLWFERKLRSISAYQEAIKRTIAVGKALGDSFAWLFYHRQRRLLYKHSLQEQQFHLPPGLGGAGERAFIENYKLIDENFVVYHNITNFLRLGDISFINLKNFELTAIGELKTKMVKGDEAEVVPFITGPESRLPIVNGLELTPSEVFKNKLEPKLRERLKKQVASIQSLFESSSSTNSTRMDLGSYNCELEALLENVRVGKITHKRAGGGLIIVAYSDTRKKLSSRCMKEDELDEDLWIKRSHGLNKEIWKLLKETKATKPLVTEVFNPIPHEHMSLGATPLFWWPIRETLVEKVLFLNVRLYTLFSPNHLFQKLRSCGYTIEYNKEQRDYAVSKEIKGKKVCFFGLRYFIDMTARQLYTENTVVKMLDALSNKFEQEDTPTNTRIDLNVMQKFF